MNQDSTNTDCAKADDFVELLAQHDQSLTRYVMSLVPSMADSQDILQETKVALWRSFGSFESGTDFAA
ncbi:sigma factor [Fuerstiella marisgermanici]|uniref:sigma factor n=1 Tax=Fuerstiella marisgermanici TaxID=1891926 RepID=UPI0009FB8F35|nr:sigma factor [Fuerstiella marisgermanici]